MGNCVAIGAARLPGENLFCTDGFDAFVGRWPQTAAAQEFDGKLEPYFGNPMVSLRENTTRPRRARMLPGAQLTR